MSNIYLEFDCEEKCHQLSIVTEVNSKLDNYWYSRCPRLSIFDPKTLINLPRFCFKSLNSVLQRELYQICYPVNRKQFWTASKTTRNLGQKPKTYISDDYTFYEGWEVRERRRLLPGNYVIKIRWYFNTDGKQFYSAYHRFFEMNHWFFRQEPTSYYDQGPVFPVDTRLLKLQSVVVQAKLNCQFDAIFKFMPKLRHLTYFSKAETGWEKFLPKYRVPLVSCDLERTVTSDPAAIHEFLSIQSLRFLYVKDVEDGKKQEFYKYFTHIYIKEEMTVNFRCNELEFAPKSFLKIKEENESVINEIEGNPR
uniref:Uncharacterized protein n=1 Tax=Panagrolaimus sp. JU765 TaxID=591449 RepID=A0AC34R3D1_9BILA